MRVLSLTQAYHFRKLPLPFGSGEEANARAQSRTSVRIAVGLVHLLFLPARV